MNMHKLRHGRAGLASLLLLCGLLGTGCQTARSSYSFEPLPSTAPPVRETPPTATRVAGVPEVTPARFQAIPKPAVRKSQARFTHRAGQVPVALLARVAPAATQRRPTASARAVQRQAAPQAPAEMGLGTTVLGVLGLVALPIGLIGLLLTGGLAWGVIAGLGALAVLVAWWDPFG